MRFSSFGLVLAGMAAATLAAQEGAPDIASQPTSCADGRNVQDGQSCDAETNWPGPYIVFFNWGGTGIDRDAEDILDAAALAFRDAPQDIRLVLTGHSDRSGPAAVNERISRQRAKKVREELIARGVPAGSVQVRGAGEGETLIATADEVREAQNRRVEIIYEAAPGS